jgi:uncharacterized protein YyaL (SSP411 family)
MVRATSTVARVPNRLTSSTSPYLQQHAENPVDWFEWGDEAFAEARRRDVPVLLSVGYAACHWCHVMAHESFEDVATAEVMNAGFVSIKVDREERPDVDAGYMEAVQAMTGHGGWPMTAFLTPQGRVFYAGTYFPKQQHHQMPSFAQVLAAVTDAWTTRRDEVESTGARISAQLAARSVLVGEHPPTAPELDAAVSVLAADFDHTDAGFGTQPKFPPSMALEWLLRHHHRTGRADALAMVTATCERMARGGMYDQLAGGFARYSVDRAWVVPHFEKMLYDNALLLRVYLHWFSTTGSPLAERIVRETAAFLLRDLGTDEGAFASALDADAEGVEGVTYAWTPVQLVEVLGGADGAWAAELLTVTPRGTFEHGLSTLQLRTDPDDAARWADIRARLLLARAGRPQPARDDKVVAAWNGLAITALAEASVVLDVPEWLDAACSCADLLMDVHRRDGRLRRVSRDGIAGEPAGVLEDYGAVAEGLLALLAATGEPAWLAHAQRLLVVALDQFTHEGQLYDTAADATDERLGRRPLDPTDNAAPSGRSALVHALLVAGAFTGDERYRAAAEQALGTAQALAGRAPRFVSWALAAAESAVDGPVEVAIVGDSHDPATAALHRTAVRAAMPGSAVVTGEPRGHDAAAVDASPVPLLAHRDLVDGGPAAYVCRGFVCRRPVTDPAVLAAELRSRVPR